MKQRVHRDSFSTCYRSYSRTSTAPSATYQISRQALKMPEVCADTELRLVPSSSHPHSSLKIIDHDLEKAKRSHHIKCSKCRGLHTLRSILDQRRFGCGYICGCYWGISISSVIFHWQASFKGAVWTHPSHASHHTVLKNEAGVSFHPIGESTFFTLSWFTVSHDFLHDGGSAYGNNPAFLVS
jgi:hypothetical protein